MSACVRECTLDAASPERARSRDDDDRPTSRVSPLARVSLRRPRPRSALATRSPARPASAPVGAGGRARRGTPRRVM